MSKVSWVDVLHYGSGVTLVLVGGLTELGAQLPGVIVSDPKAVMATGVGILVAGLKGGWTSGATK